MPNEIKENIVALLQGMTVNDAREVLRVISHEIGNAVFVNGYVEMNPLTPKTLNGSTV